MTKEQQKEKAYEKYKAKCEAINKQAIHKINCTCVLCKEYSDNISASMPTLE